MKALDEYKQLTEQLPTYRESLQVLVDEGVITIDAEGTIRLTQSAWEGLTSLAHSLPPELRTPQPAHPRSRKCEYD